MIGIAKLAYLPQGRSRLRLVVTAVLLLLTGRAVHAQAVPPELIAEVGRGGEVTLRWAPASRADYTAFAKTGYAVLRAPLDDTLAKTVVATGIQPATRAAFAAQADNRSAQTLAAVIYGEGLGSPAEADMAYGFALFAAELDSAAARLAGLAYVDRDAPPTPVRYTLVAADALDSAGGLVPAGGFDESRAARVDVDPTVPTTYPPPADLAGERAGGRAELQWRRAATDDDYSAYRVERATGDAEDWVTLHRLPLLQLLDTADADPDQYFVDTAAAPELAYRYRVRGYTSFGHLGPPSEELALAPEVLPLVTGPRITALRAVVDTLYRLAWSAPTDPQAVAGYRVWASDDPLGERVPVRYAPADTPELLPADQLEVGVVERVDARFYYVEAIGTNGLGVVGPPAQLRVFDRTPPPPPSGLVAEIDTLGILTVAWAPVEVPDLSGYRVFAANRPEGYFPQLTRAEVPLPRYTDTVTMATASEDVYVKVVAVDLTGNYSEFSEVLTVTRPDLVPPAPPALGLVSGSAAGVRLELRASSSADVVYTLVERLREGGDAWVALDTLRGALPPAYLDTLAEVGARYRYRLAAVDDAGWRAASASVGGGRTDDGLRGAIEAFDVALTGTPATPTLAWRYPAGAGLDGFQVYRQRPGAPPTPVAYLSDATPALRLVGGTFYYRDRDVPAGPIVYQVQARHRDGGRSTLTEALAPQTAAR